MTTENLSTAIPFEDLDDDLMPLIDAPNLQPAKGGKKKPKVQADRPAAIAPSAGADPAPTKAGVTTPSGSVPVQSELEPAAAVTTVMDLLGVIPDAVNDVALLASTVRRVFPVKDTLLVAAMGVAAAAITYITLRGEQR